ncbi:hypothetical protein [Pseudomonas sp. NMS19W]|uniref:glycine-rich domain-containing protein n=1 Tax=Pseudomonas sp. NMS19W TaxID=3079768 RepID=UPI003F65794D
MDYPKSVPGIGLVNGKFVNEDVVGGLPGSLIPATWGNGITDELLNVVKSAGLEPSENDVTQLLLAIKRISQSGEDKHAADIGAANLYMANYVPAISALKDGLTLRFTAGNANTGASTFAPNGLLPKPLLSLALSALRPAEIVGGSVCSVVYSAARDSWLLVYASGGNATSGRLLNVKTFTASGVYVPTAGMKNVLVKVVGGGGGSAGVSPATSTQYGVSGGGASGSYAEAWLDAKTIGISQVITVGISGAAGAIASSGASGGTSSFGSLVSAPGGGASPWIDLVSPGVMACISAVHQAPSLPEGTSSTVPARPVRRASRLQALRSLDMVPARRWAQEERATVSAARRASEPVTVLAAAELPMPRTSRDDPVQPALPVS